VESQQAATVDTSTTVNQQLISAAPATVFVDDYSSDVQQHESCTADDHELDTMSESCQSFTALQTKPPLVRKGKTRERNIRSLFKESFGSHSSKIAFNSGVAGPAEPVRRHRLRLPWMKQKQHYKPSEELSHWTSNFDSWIKSASQSSLESDTAGANTASVWRTRSQSELQNIDSVSVGWTDSDTDIMSDDPMSESFNNYTSKPALFIHIILYSFIACLPAFLLLQSTETASYCVCQLPRRFFVFWYQFMGLSVCETFKKECHLCGTIFLWINLDLFMGPGSYFSIFYCLYRGQKMCMSNQIKIF